MYFPSLFVARYIQSMRFKKPYILVMGLFQRIPWLIAAFIGFSLGTSRPNLVIFWLMTALFITQAGTGLAISAFFDMTVKTIPRNLRGRLFALRNLGSYLIGLLCGGLISWILNALPFPDNFPVLIIIGFVLLMFYLPTLGSYKEPPSRRIRFSDESFGEFFILLTGILKKDNDFRRYVWGRVFVTLAFTSYSYFAFHLIRRYSLHESQAGLFTIVTAATFILANPLLGFLADRWGHLINHTISSVALIIGNMAILFTDSYIPGLVSIVMGALTLCINNVSQSAIVVEFGQDHEIPLYISIVGFVVGISSLAIIPLGILSEIYGLNILFWTCLAAAAASLGIFLTVKEPRQHRPPTVLDAC